VSSRKRAAPKFYAVARGRAPGIYTSWPECDAQVNGFAGAVHKAFGSQAEAEDYLRQHEQPAAAAAQAPTQAAQVDAFYATIVEGADPALLTPDVQALIKGFLSGALPQRHGVEKVLLHDWHVVDDVVVCIVLELNFADKTWRKLLRKRLTPVAPPPPPSSFVVSPPIDDAASSSSSSSSEPSPLAMAELSRLAARQLASSPAALFSSQAHGSDAPPLRAVASPAKRARLVAQDDDDDDDDEASDADACLPLSADQKRVFDLAMQRESLFFTGPGGCGKSFLLERIVRALTKDNGGDPRTVAVTASTGAAGLNIGGSTIHSWAGIGLGQGEAAKLAAIVFSSKLARARWCAVKTLIIDEVSMISAELFEKLEFVARYVRARDRGLKTEDMAPFGGIQVLLSGDFLQLPPVFKDGASGKFAFDCEAWRRVVGKNVCVLSSVFRQEDRALVRVLNQLRRGIFTEEARQMLNSRVDARVRKPVQLRSRRDEVDAFNETQLALLKGQPVQFIAQDSFSGPPDSSQHIMHKLDNCCLAVPTLVLKQGAQVLLIRNLDVRGGLVNGSQGFVDGFQEAPPPPPGLELNPNQAHFDRRIKWPFVRFANGRRVLVTPEKWSVEENANTASRTQVPLILAWAISIHKAQGMSLDACEVDVKSNFAAGQAYVALSRVKSLEGLSLKHPLSASHFRYDKRVVEFYESIGDRLNDDEANAVPAQAANEVVGVVVPEAPVAAVADVAAVAVAKPSVPPNSMIECVVCLARPVAVAFGCGHLTQCATCAQTLSTCPMCRQAVTSRLTVFMP
jgi:ATP-dependent DNA helicase PIF1